LKGWKNVSQKHRNTKAKNQVNKKKRHAAGRKQRQTWAWLGVGAAAIVIMVAALILIPRLTANPQISVDQAYQKYKQGAFFLDVRAQAEWDQAHIANSTLIPLDDLPGHFSDLPKDRDIVVVCLTGHRALEGVTLLRNAGFSRATCLTGGLTAWKAAGYPLEDSNP
jgi:rhodanese-related sulfurtransferase